MNVKNILASVNSCATMMYVRFKPKPPFTSLWTFLLCRKTRTKGTDMKDRPLQRHLSFSICTKKLTDIRNSSLFIKVRFVT